MEPEESLSLGTSLTCANCSSVSDRQRHRQGKLEEIERLAPPPFQAVLKRTPRLPTRLQGLLGLGNQLIERLPGRLSELAPNTANRPSSLPSRGGDRPQISQFVERHLTVTCQLSRERMVVRVSDRRYNPPHP